MTAADAIGAIQNIQQTIAHLDGRSTATNAADTELFARLLAALSGSGTAPSASQGGTDGAAVASAAQKYLGVPYVLGGVDSSGIDCSGLVQRTFADLGVEVPRLVSTQKTVGTEVPSLAEARPGDLIVTEGGDHISIYLGNNKVIHAPDVGRNVQISELWVGDSGIETIRRIVPSGSEPSGLGGASLLGAGAFGFSGLGASSFGSGSSGLGSSALGSLGLGARGLGSAGIGSSGTNDTAALIELLLARLSLAQRSVS